MTEEAQVASGFTDAGVAVSAEHVCPNIFSFCAFMSAVVADRRGGQPSEYISECADFMTEVVGKRLSVADPLPDDFDWRVSAAKECADAMMECDSD